MNILFWPLYFFAPLYYSTSKQTSLACSHLREVINGRGNPVSNLVSESWKGIPMEEGDRRDTVRNSVSNPDCLFYHMLQSHIYLSDESRHCRQGLNLKNPAQ